jgi:hypothetical protein
MPATIATRSASTVASTSASIDPGSASSTAWARVDLELAQLGDERLDGVDVPVGQVEPGHPRLGGQAAGGRRADPATRPDDDQRAVEDLARRGHPQPSASGGATSTSSLTSRLSIRSAAVSRYVAKCGESRCACRAASSRQISNSWKRVPSAASR